MKKVKFTRPELYELVWSHSLLSLSKKYHISDNGIRKACKRMNIPLPLMGHWQKVQFGKKVNRRPLPAYDGKETEIELEIRSDKDNTPPMKDLVKEIENDPSLPTTVPRRLSNPDPLIESAQASLEENCNGRWKDHGLINTKSGEVNIQVSPQNYRRALRFMDTFIKLINARGHKLEVSGNDTIAIINEEYIKISLKEKWDITKETDERGWVSHIKSPSGILMLRIDELYSKQWKDGKKLKLEEQLARILIEIEKYAEKEKKRKHEIEEDWRKYHEQERRKKEYQQRKQDELQKFRELIFDASRWHQTIILRQYINTYESFTKEKGKMDFETKEWLQWAKGKVDWLDPFIEKEDYLLTDVEREEIIKELFERKGKQDSKPKHTWNY